MKLTRSLSSLIAACAMSGALVTSCAAIDIADDPSVAGAARLGSVQRVGILYELWHCPASASPRYNGGAVSDTSRARAGLEPWVGIPGFSWWGRPDDGYYCLADGDAVLVDHAQKLRDAGVDFIVVDGSNWGSTTGGGTAPMIIDPFDALVRVWSQIPGAPKVVPWVPMSAGSDMADYFIGKLNASPSLTFVYEGKPLVLAVDNGTWPIDPTLFARVQSQFTVRKMWGLLTPAEASSGKWSFMQSCEPGFRDSQGQADCNQTVVTNNGVVEQVPVAAAYQTSYMSDTSTATPKNHGLTFLRQLQAAYRHPEASIVLVNSWNEWMAQRFCVNGGVTCDGSGDHFPNGEKVFVDEYDPEFSRDLEPGGGLGAHNYYLMKNAIALLHAGQDPLGAMGVVPYRPNETLGTLDGIYPRGDGSYDVGGWVCAIGLAAPIDADLYFGATFITRAQAATPSEPAVAERCQGSGTAYRFRFPVSAAQIAQFTGQAISVYGINPFGLGNASVDGSTTVLVPSP